MRNHHLPEDGGKMGSRAEREGEGLPWRKDTSSTMRAVVNMCEFRCVQKTWCQKVKEAGSEVTC